MTMLIFEFNCFPDLEQMINCALEEADDLVTASQDIGTGNFWSEHGLFHQRPSETTPVQSTRPSRHDTSGVRLGLLERKLKFNLS